MAKRFIQTRDLPKTLWCNDSKVMFLPAMLVDQWKKLLEVNNLDDMALTEAEKGFVGGVTKEDTDKHLAWRYNGSCSRIILSLLDPHHDLSEVADTYASIFSGNEVFLADLPCGSGAASISILSTLAELRKEGVVPRLPLKVVIVAGEISETAREYYEYQLEALKPLLGEQAIWIEYKLVHWNVLDPICTANLTQELILKSQNCNTRLLLISNFTGFLEASNNWTLAKVQLDQIFLHSRDKQSAAIWIEPQKKKVIPFMEKITIWFYLLFDSVLNLSNTDKGIYATTESKCKQAIKEGMFPVRLTVVRFNLPQGKS